MSVYKKLQLARVNLYDAGLKQSGANKHSNTTYFELVDFTVDAQRIFNDVGLSSVFSMDIQNATLSIIDVDTSEKADFSCPVFLAQLPKESEKSVKNLGATITYLRRYLWMSALEIPQKEVAELVANHDKQSYTIAQADANIEKWNTGNVSGAGIVEKIKGVYSVSKDVEKYIIDNVKVKHIDKFTEAFASCVDFDALNEKLSELTAAASALTKPKITAAYNEKLAELEAKLGV